MKKIATVVCCAMLLTLSGCGSSPDSLMEDQIDLMNEAAEAIENGADKAKLEDIEKRGKALNEKMEKLELSDEEKKKLVEKYKPEIEKAMSRLMKAAMAKAAKDGGKKVPDFSFFGK